MIRHPVRPLDDIDPEDLARFDHAGRTYAPNRDTNSAIFGSKGQCTHGQVHPGNGSVMGDEVECRCINACSTTRPALRSGSLAQPFGISKQHFFLAQ